MSANVAVAAGVGGGDAVEEGQASGGRCDASRSVPKSSHERRGRQGALGGTSREGWAPMRQTTPPPPRVGGGTALGGTIGVG